MAINAQHINCNRFFREHYNTVINPSVICLFVRFVRPISRLKFSVMFLRHLVPWPSVDIQVKFYRVPGNPTIEGVKRKRGSQI